jgi:hypothetical protein
MATVREGNKAVLLVVDVQVGVMNEAWDAPRVIKNVSKAGSSRSAVGSGHGAASEKYGVGLTSNRFRLPEHIKRSSRPNCR